MPWLEAGHPSAKLRGRTARAPRTLLSGTWRRSETPRVVLKDPQFLSGFVRLLRRLRDALHALSHLSGSKGPRFGTPHPFNSSPGVGLRLQGRAGRCPAARAPRHRSAAGAIGASPARAPVLPRLCAPDRVSSAGRLSRPGLPSPARFRSGLTCPPGAGQPCTFTLQGSIRGRLSGVTGGARGPPDRCPPPGAPAVWVSLWGHPVLSLSPGSRAVRAPAAPEPPAAHPLLLPLLLPLLTAGGCGEVGKRESERSGLKIEKGSQP